MPDAQGRERIAILGGGIGALTTAFELTATPELRAKYAVTVHTLGWRLGGKCATGRGPNGRIQEHGIHGFLGSYYNALPLMARVYEELDRPEGHPLRRFQDAFRAENDVLMWEVADGGWRRWMMALPTNERDPANPEDVAQVSHYMLGAGPFIHGLLDELRRHLAHEKGWRAWLEAKALGVLEDGLDRALRTDPQRVVGDLEAIRDWLWKHLRDVIAGTASLRHVFMQVDYIAAMLRALIKYDVATRGFDPLDDMNFADMLTDCGLTPLTLGSPLTLNTTNLSYQYPRGDTSLPPDMAAGAYLHWSLRSFAYLGSFAWLFEAGTGETIIQPLYELLKRRGVRFEFFHKVEALTLTADRRAVATVEIGVQATPKPGLDGYDPLIRVGELMCWPDRPLTDRLAQGAELEQGDELPPARCGEGPTARPCGGYDLESWWTAWKPVQHLSLRAGEDFDRVVFAISIGAVPHLCPALIEANPAWGRMCEHVTTVPTQALQIWLRKTSTELGAAETDPDVPLSSGVQSDNTDICATFANPQSGVVDFSHLMRWETWPTSGGPKSLWYACGPMDDYDPIPPFTDHAYPKRMDDRVRWQSVQWLQAATGPMLPKAVTNVQRAPGDGVGLDFGLLVCTEDDAATGIARFAQQFHRANIDPTERYVTSPAGSTKYRIKAGETGFANLVISGDWIYTGLNVGSVEGTVMGGRAAANAISGLPRLEDIPGYLLGASRS